MTITRLCPNCGTPLAAGVLRGRCPDCKREQDQAKNKRRTAARCARSTGRWQAVRAQAIRRDGNRCSNCGSTEELEGHHIRPLAKGGSAYSLDNVITLCASCHQQKDSTRKPDRPVQTPVAPILVAQRPAKHRFNDRDGAEPEDE